MWLRDVRRQPATLASLLFWDSIESMPEGVMYLKDGSLLATIAYRGPDLESAMDSELVTLAAQVNNLLKRFGAGWALWTEARRHPVQAYPVSTFPDPISQAVDDERRRQFTTPNQYYATDTYLSLAYRPPKRARHGWRSWVYTDLPQADPDAHTVERFAEECTRTVQLLGGCCPEARLLDHGGLLTYLHSTVSPKAQALVRVPAQGSYLDSYLTDTDFSTGLYPHWGDPDYPATFGGWLRCISPCGRPGHAPYPEVSHPGMFQALDDLAIPYRACLRYLPLDPTHAARLIENTARSWQGQRKSGRQILTEKTSQQESAIVQKVADAYTEDATNAQMAVQRGTTSYGYCTQTIVVWDTDPDEADRKAGLVEVALKQTGCTVRVEDWNTCEAWLGTLPGDTIHNVRRPLLSSQNMAHMMPLMQQWRGPETNAHLQGPPVCYAVGKGKIPVRVSLHDGDVSHVALIGRTGNGKSTLINFLCLQQRRYRDAEIIIFDKGGAARALTPAVGGVWADMGMTPLQPLARLDRDHEIPWAVDWLDALLTQERVLVTPELKEDLYEALLELAGYDTQKRTLSQLVQLVETPVLKTALRTYTKAGPYGALLDAEQDHLSTNPWLCFELEKMLTTPQRLGAVLPALFHRLEQRLTGVPTMYFLHEAWSALRTPYWEKHLEAQLKGMRVKNCGMFLATQSLSDMVDSPITGAILDNVPTWIYTANSRAREQHIGKYYTALGLNERERECIATMIPKRQYYVSATAGKMLIDMELGPISLAACRTLGPAELRTIDAMAEAHPDDFSEYYRKTFLANVSL